eukprot:TRINITY_DN11364_c0_g1_i1.p1 TRINITY_DN11364_c0_g1~~TRINITY_DN11364_c0_g1_i1.p1  ORF type:complete len:120 (-),score=37.55 TRINITY_DN11364_c0_g1_i1:54-389(-)
MGVKKIVSSLDMLSFLSFLITKQAFLVVIYFSISIYFILSVYSFYMIIKIQKKSVTHFLDHEFQGGAGEESFYRPLEDSQEQIPPFREKKVPMHDHEDFGRENVLYAKTYG